MGLKVGLTGGIGSGKSLVAGIFEVLGIPVYYADEAAKRLQNSDPELKAKIIDLLGSGAYLEGRLNRKYISDIVFGDQEKLNQLNALVHPATIRDAENWLKSQDAAYAIKEAALIFESGSQRDLDYVIGVSAPETLRIKRTVERDGISPDEVMKRMGSQITDRVKMRLCHFVIYNDEKQLLIPQVLAIHQKLISLSLNDSEK